MLRAYRSDLHVHTVLSPCTTYRMAPGEIVARAREVGLDLIAITDHNSVANAAAVIEAAGDSGLRVLPGMEVESREEVHILALFGDYDRAARWGEIVYAHLPDLPNDETVFGAQLIVNACDEYIRHEQRRLIIATSLSIEEIVASVARLGGLCIASHVDRPAYGLLGVLGFVPPGLNVVALEVSRFGRVDPAMLMGRTAIRSSDAHDLDDLGTAVTTFHLAELTLQEMELACRGIDGRHLQIEPPL